MWPYGLRQAFASARGPRGRALGPVRRRLEFARATSTVAMAFERVKLALACESKTLASGSKARRPVWATGPSHRAEPANVRGETSMYHIVFQRDGFEVGTLYWNVKFNETLGLARVIGLRCEADVFRIVEVTEGAEVCSEQAPYGLVGAG